MKILFITQSLTPNSGWGRYSSSIIKAVKHDGHSIKIVVEEGQSSDNEVLPLLKSPVKYLANPITSCLSAKKVNGVVNDFQPEIIHFMVEPYVHILPFLRVSTDTKIFLTAHGSYSFIPSLFPEEKLKLFLSKSLTKKAFSKLSKIISVSSYTKEYMEGEYQSILGKKLQKEVHVISNGVDNSLFGQVQSRDTKSNKTIIFVGAVKKRKGVIETLRAISSYIKKYKENISYIIAGDKTAEPDYVDIVIKEIKNLGLEDKVSLVGSVSKSDLDSLYSKADLLISLPIQKGSFFEGFGLVYLEANAHGVPAIGSTKSGARDAILDGFSGYLVDSQDENQIIEKIHKVLNGSIKREDCISWAEKQDIKNKIKILLDLYRV